MHTTPQKTASSKTRALNKPAEPGGTQMFVERQAGEEDAAAHARTMLDPATNATVTAYQFHAIRNGADVTAMLNEVRTHCAAVRDGDMSRPEAMLVAQSHTLDVLFNTLAQKAADHLAHGHLQVMENFLRLAFKAQSQARTTVEALVELKYPKSATFIKQANIAGGPQQVNNVEASPVVRERNISHPTELLEASHGERLDGGAASASGTTHQDMEPLEQINGAALPRRKTSKQPEWTRSRRKVGAGRS